MTKTVLAALLFSCLAAGQTVTITSITSAQVVSGTVPLKLEISSAPSVASVDWVLNSYYLLARIQHSASYSYNWKTGFVLDGPATIQAIAKDATGTVVASSTPVNFAVKNHGVVVTVNSPSSFQTNPTISGNITIDYTANISAGNIENSICTVDGMPIAFQSSGYFTTTYAVVWNTAQLPNGPHLFTCKTEQLAASLSPAAVGPSTVATMQVQFQATTSNGHTVMAVKPDITDVVLVPSGGNACSYGSWTPPCGSFQLAPVLAYTDNTTGSSAGLTYSADYDCNPADPARPDWPFLCASGNQYPLTSAQGSAYVTVNSSGLITAASKGHAVVKVTDTASGLIGYVNVIVGQYASPPHFSASGAILHSYTPGQSIFRSSMYNLDPVSLITETDPNPNGSSLLTHYVKSGFTAFEANEYRTPGCAGGNCVSSANPYPNEAAWQADLSANELPAITNAQSAAPSLCTILRTETLLQSSGFTDAVSGPSTSWSPNPLAYYLGQLAATNKMCGWETKDEVNSGLGFGPTGSMKFSNGTLSSIVTGGSSGSGVTRIFTAYSSPNNSQYLGAARFPGGSVKIINATSSGLNGVVPVTRVWISNLNDWEHHDTLCADGESQFSGNPPCQTFDVTTSAANGTYNATTDPNLEVLGYGDPAEFPVFSGQSPMPNNKFTVITAAARTAGIPIAWPTLAAGDLVTQTNWQSSAMADYVSAYTTEGAPDLGGSYRPAFAWGESFQYGQYSVMGRKWGEVANQSNADALNGYPLPYLPYWRQDGTGFSNFQQDVPQSLEVSADGMDYYPGGRVLTISAMSGACMTTTTANGVATPDYSNLMPWVRAIVSGSSDSEMNTGSYSGGGGQWLLGFPCGSGGIEVYSWVAGLPGSAGGSSFAACTPSTSTPGTISIRGTTYSYNIAGSGLQNIGLIGVTTTIPPNIAPGEHVITAGNSVSCWNQTWAFVDYRPDQGVNWFEIAPFVSSIGTGGTVKLNDDHGFFDPLQDFSNGLINKPEAIGPEMIFAAGVGYAAVRNYAYQVLGTSQSQERKSLWPFSGSDYQTQPVPYVRANQDTQRRWWADAQVTALLSRIAPFNFGSYLPSPNLSVVSQYPLVWTQCTAHSGSVGNILSCTNFSEISQTLTVDHTKYQISTNPVSQYRIVYPGMHTDLLTGTLSSTTYTLAPGESVILLYSADGTSYVSPETISGAAPSGATQMYLQYSYIYSNPLAEDGFSVECGSVTTCTVNLDKSLGTVTGRRVYLNSGNQVVATGDLETL
jgi:hypothetical protein